MKVFLLTVLATALSFAQAADCQKRTACEASLRKNPKNSLAHYRLGEIFLKLGDKQLAANHFNDALEGDLNPRWVEVWAHVNLGKIFDIVGVRKRAVREYEKAQQTSDNTRGALNEAARYLAAPYRPL